MIYAVIDTNVIVSAFYTKNRDAATVKLLYAIYEHLVTPVIHNGILQEYNDVLHRQKFHFDMGEVENTINFFRDNGIPCARHNADTPLPDEDDRIFLEAALAAREKYGSAYLVTGNKKHFPAEPFILSPAELLSVLSADR